MKSIIKVVLASFLLLALLGTAVLRSQAGVTMAGITFTVNTSTDLPDATPGDGLCEATAGVGDCTLRAATMEANANSEPDITINLPAGVYGLTIPASNPEDEAHGSLKIYRSLTILGAGSNQTTIDGNGDYINDRAVEVLSNADNSAITIQGLTIQDGYASTALTTGALGGGMYASLGDEAGASGSLTLMDVLIKRNSALGSAAGGGGLYLEGWSQSSFALANVVVSDNSVDSDGHAGAGLQFESGGYDQAGLYSSLLIQDSSIQNNRAIPLTTGNPWGGGLDIRHGLVTITGSTLANNLADYGGAISVDGESSLVDLVNSTLSGNQADLDGGGIYAVNGLTNLFSTTMIGNNSDYDLNGTGQGGGVYQAGDARVTLANSLVIYNHESYYDAVQQMWVTRHWDLRGTYNSEGYNAFSNTDTCVFTGDHQLDRYDITLDFIGALAFNGGNTLTRMLLAGSEAINAANPDGCNDPDGNPLATDQRGFSRVIGGRCDIGAYESNPILYLPLVQH
jgi:hypothetical protein